MIDRPLRLIERKLLADPLGQHRMTNRPEGDADMEHPIFSLSTKPDLRIRRYVHGTRYVEITPSVKGLATVHD